jgi:hypothetical protein
LLYKGAVIGWFVACCFYDPQLERGGNDSVDRAGHAAENSGGLKTNVAQLRPTKLSEHEWKVLQGLGF